MPAKGTLHAGTHFKDSVSWPLVGWSSRTKNLPDWFLTIADLLNVGFDRLGGVQFEGQLIHNMNMNT